MPRLSLGLVFALAGALSVGALAGAWVGSESSLRVVLPASSLEASSLLPSTIVSGAESFQVSPSVIAFGALRPGATSVVELQVTNLGASPLRLSLEGSPLVEPVTGVAIGSDRMTVEAPAGALAPGEAATLRVTLQAPRGSQTWLPAGDYSGAFSLVGVVVS